MAQKKLVPPDGGWGWMIVLAYALNQLILVPIMQNFGLVFKDTFVELGFSATDGSILININAACSMLTGLINAPMLKIFGYRKVSIVGAVFTTVGVITTAYADSFLHFLITYGLITSLGMGMGMSSYPLAMNSYFLKRRNKATGIAMTITGLGPVLMPQLISFLLYVYDVQGAMLIIGAVAAHSFIGASLLQPHQWHMKYEIVEDEEDAIVEGGGDEKGQLDKLPAITEKSSEYDASSKSDKDETTVALIMTKEELSKQDESSLYDKTDAAMESTLSIDHDMEVHAIYGMDTPLTGSVLSLNPGPRQRLYSVSSTIDGSQTINRWWSVNSVSKPNGLPRDQRIPGGYNRTQSVPRDVESKLNSQSLNETKLTNPTDTLKPVYDTDMTTPAKKRKGLLKRIGAHLVKMFDLNLLRDPIYVNIMIGMSLAIFAELNFSMLTPFIMADFNLNTPQIATFLSVLSIADICFRFISPFIGDFLNKPPRIMYMFSLFLLIITRFSLLLFEEYYHLLWVGVALGVAKGIRTVYWTLVIPAYVPIEKLAAASGIQMVVNGIFIFLGGPLLGVIRDVTGSYKNCIIVINCVTFGTLILWTTELLIKKYKHPKIVNEKSELTTVG